MPFRVAFFWKQQSTLEGGWTENYWNTGASFTDVGVRAEALRVAWTTYKGNPTYCPQLRISDTNTFRNTELVFTGGNPQTISPATDADYPTTKGLMVLRSAQGLKTRQWAGGLRDRDVLGSGKWNPASSSVAVINVVWGLLTSPANGWAIRVLDPTVLPVVILSINAATGVVTTAANTIPDNARVRIKGVKGLTTANGIWRVTKLSDTTFQLQGWVPSTAVMTKGNGTIRNQVYVFQSIAAVDIVRTTSHRVGKPAGLLGGRRRRRTA
jgi:hypothetical protein